jgi:YegS/Rv2252/BmrU family lipid kinase
LTWAILNPRAGVAARRARKAIEEHRDRWGDLEVRTTESPGHAQLLAQEAVQAGATTVLAVGGDGTVNEVAWGLLGTTVTLGLVPVGSGNGLARTLGIPLRPDRALASLEAAVARGMDVGLVNGRPFLNVAGAGFDAEVGAAFHRNGARGGRRGVLTYVRLGFSKLTYQAEEWLLSMGEERFEGRALLVAFVNGRQYGGGAFIAPRARLDDGLLDIVVIEDAPRAEILLNAPRVFLGSIEGFRRYRHRTASSAVLTSRGGAFEHHRDGEPEPSSERLEVAVQPRALRVLVPRQVAEDPKGPFR